jgi:glycosyltransferase involved in cell wall biosynthesis
VHEGFGIPLLEAMACGIPVITSGGGSLPEVAGDAALIVTDPMDVAGFAMAIERVLGEASVRDDMIRRGTARAAEFSWDRSARKMLRIYETVLGKVDR